MNLTYSLQFFSPIPIFNKVHDFFLPADFNDMEAQYTDEINEAVSM